MGVCAKSKTFLLKKELIKRKKLLFASRINQINKNYSISYKVYCANKKSFYFIKYLNY